MSDDCLFCRIVAKELPSDVVHEDEHVIAFRDIQPQAPTHVLVVPRRHVPTLADVASDDDGQALLGHLMAGVRDAAAKLGLEPSNGYRAVINCGETAAQSVFHLHVHVLGGRILGWPPG